MNVPSHRFTSPTWLRALCAFGALACPLATYSLVSSEGWSLLALGSVLVSAMACGGLADAFTCKVELFAEHLVVVANLVRREYPRQEFVGVSWAKGVPVTLHFASGGFLRLPDVGSSAQGVTNSLRAWLK